MDTKRDKLNMVEVRNNVGKEGYFRLKKTNDRSPAPKWVKTLIYQAIITAIFLVIRWMLG